MKPSGRIKLLLPAFLLMSLSVWAQHEECDCPEHPGEVNKAVVESYDLVFRGKVQQAGNCTNGTASAVFEGLELFRGEKVPRYVTLNYSCGKACSYDFEKGTEWLLYARNDSVNTGRYLITFCERSRRFIADKKDDSYTMFNDMSWDEELAYLRKKVHPKPIFIENSDVQKIEEQNLKVIDANRDITIRDANKKMILIGISFLVMIIFILAFKKWFKTDR